MKKCSKCKETKPFNTFNKNRAAKDGYNNQCRDCMAEARTKKGIVTVNEALDFIKSLTDSGTLFECKNCGKSKTADKFYYKRSNGKVQLATSNCKECQLVKHRLKNFGISEEEYQELLAKQGNKCLLCLVDHDEYVETSYKNKRFAIDHCHTTGKIRGLLCDKCNRGLGFFNDDIESLKRAINYLKDYEIV